MPQSLDEKWLDSATLSDGSLYRLIENQENEWSELPEDRVFAQMEAQPPQKRFAKLRNKLRDVFRKKQMRARQYEFQPI